MKGSLVSVPLCLAVFFGFFLSLANAANITVVIGPDTECGDSVCDFPSALAYAATNGESDVLNMPAQTFTTSATFTYSSMENHALSIVGQGAGQTVLDGTGTVQVLDIFAMADSLADISISGVSIEGGNSGGVADGGGLRARTYRGDVSIMDCAFTGNTSGTMDGGGAHLEVMEFGNGKATFSSCAFADNTAGNGGGLYVNFPVVSLVGSSFNFNGVSTSSDGGGAHVQASLGPVEVSGNTFTGNYGESGSRGGGIYLRGGGVYTSTVSDNLFDSNTLGNDSEGGGAYVSAVDSPVKIAGNIFTGNEVGESLAVGGGGLKVTSFGSMSSVSAVNNVIVNNSAQLSAGALFDVEMGMTTLTNNTVSGNVSSAGAGLQLDVASARIYNNIFWGDTVMDLYLGDYGGFGATFYLYNNVIGSVVKESSVDTTNSGQNSADDPDLQVDGYHLDAGSYAINAGTDSAPGLSLLGGTPLDIDGEDRFQESAIDIGADEYSGIPRPLLDVDPLSHNFGTVAVAGTTTPVTMTIANEGSLIMTVTGIALADTVNFSLDLGGGIQPCGAPPVVIGPGGECNATVAFSPTAAVAYSTVLSVTSSDAVTGTVNALLTGSGQSPEPDISVDPASLVDFIMSVDTLPSGSGSTLTVTNAGALLLTVSGVSLGDTVNFSVDMNAGAQPCGIPIFTLGSGESCTMEVSFTPLSTASEGSYSTSLVITSSDPDTPVVEVAVAGDVVPKSGGSDAGTCGCGTQDPAHSIDFAPAGILILSFAGLLLWRRRRC